MCQGNPRGTKTMKFGEQYVVTHLVMTTNKQVGCDKMCNSFVQRVRRGGKQNFNGANTDNFNLCNPGIIQYFSSAFKKEYQQRSNSGSGSKRQRAWQRCGSRRLVKSGAIRCQVQMFGVLCDLRLCNGRGGRADAFQLTDTLRRNDDRSETC